jgi:glycosyltransferase involved in cell wall biosynthesis
VSDASPDVSFVVIGFNEEAHIEACLASILAQEQLGTFEVVVVDDASTDRTSAIVSALATDHPQLRLLRHDVNRGRGAARRTGQDACRADVIAFIDSDIELPPDWLARATVALADADVISGVAVPDGDVAVIWRIFRPVSKGIPGPWALTGNNVIFRRRALQAVGWPAHSRLTEDNRMAVAMTDAGFVVRTVPDLKVEHHEAKSYRKAFAYMVETGYNADEILRDLRLFRFPDLVWVGWAASTLSTILLAVFGVLRWWQAVLCVLGVTIAIDAGMMVQRFFFTKAPMRWLAATAGNLPLIGAYLVARTACAPRLLLRRRP